MANPIWKDYYVSLGSADSVEYRILYNNIVVYQGKAWKRPGNTEVLVRINDICSDFIQNEFPNLAASEFSNDTYPEFIIQSKMYDEWENVDSVDFYNDWSFEYDFDPATMGLAFSINGRLHPNQWIVYSAYKSSSVKAEITFIDGSKTSVYVPIETSPDFNTDFNSDFARSLRSSQSGTAVFKLSQFSNMKSLQIGNTTYEFADNCSKYVLYYQNSHGGWDSLLIEGNYSEMDSLTRHTRDVEYDNRNVQNRGSINYINEVTKILTLYTSWMSDKESSRMHHLLNSTSVYLYDIEKDQMIPALLTNGVTEYKTYKGNGGKLVNYSLEVKFANGRMRK